MFVTEGLNILTWLLLLAEYTGIGEAASLGATNKTKGL